MTDKLENTEPVILQRLDEVPLEPEIEELPEIDMRGIIPEFQEFAPVENLNLQEEVPEKVPEEPPEKVPEEPPQKAAEVQTEAEPQEKKEPLTEKFRRWKRTAQKGFRILCAGCGAFRDNFMEKITGVGPHMPQPLTEEEAYELQLRAHKRLMMLRTGFIALGVLTAVLIIRSVAYHWHYSSYEVVSTRIQEDVLSSDYAELDGKVFKYGQETASLLDENGEILWSGNYSIMAPEVYVNEMAAVIYDKNGTEMSLFNSGGQLCNIHTKLPIIKAKVSAKGYAAAILADRESTWINYYGTDGSEIATIKTRMDEPGYPMDLAVSENGALIAVTYLAVENGNPGTRVVFYNFETTGQNQVDNQVSTYSYPGVLAPQIEYVSGNRCVLMKDDGFAVYEGGQIPKETGHVNVNQEILSVFHNEKYVGMIFHSQKDALKYTMEIYRLDGKRILKKEINFPYADVKISGNQIIMNNSSQLGIVTVDGVEKFKGKLEEGLIYDILKIGSNRYLAVTEDGIHTIRLK